MSVAAGPDEAGGHRAPTPQVIRDAALLVLRVADAAEASAVAARAVDLAAASGLPVVVVAGETGLEALDAEAMAALGWVRAGEVAEEPKPEDSVRLFLP